MNQRHSCAVLLCNLWVAVAAAAWERLQRYPDRLLGSYSSLRLLQSRMWVLHTPPMNPSSTTPVIEFRRRYRSRALSHGTEGLYPSRECHVGFAAAFDLKYEDYSIQREIEPKCAHHERYGLSRVSPSKKQKFGSSVSCKSVANLWAPLRVRVQRAAKGHF